MHKLEYLKLIEARFRKNFPNSHLMIGYDLDVGKFGTSETWTFSIINDELASEDLQPEKVFESFDNFKDFDHRLGWQMHRMKGANEGIRNENALA